MVRRAAGEGSVYQRKDGSYVAQYKGKYRYAKDKDTARAKLYKMLTATEEVQPSNITVSKALDDYLNAGGSNLKPRTVKRYSEAIQVHLKPSLGKEKLHELTALRVEEMYARKLSQGTSPSTIELMHAVLSACLKRSVRLRLVQHNVCRDVERPRIESEEVEIFSPSEVAAILSTAKYDTLEALWVLALTTGMRQGEIIGLKVSDYDRAKGTLAIRRTLYNGVEGSTKSKKGRRVP